MPRTRGELLRYAISFALIGAVKVVRGVREGLSEEERYAAADKAVDQIRQHGDPWKVNEENPPTAREMGHGMPADWQSRSTNHGIRDGHGHQQKA
jgi:hypothetical protein